MKKKIIRK